MPERIVIAGGNGFVGEYLTKRFRGQGSEVIIISRHVPDVLWTDSKAVLSAIDGADLVINLAGRSVNCRYNEENKMEILESRIRTTSIIGNAILKCKIPPKLWINSSTATIYRHAEDRPMTEETGEIGKGFSVEIATGWEKTFFDFQLSQTRQAALRMAIVLGKNGGVMTPFKNLVRCGLGGKQGSGNQKFSWIHIEDLFKIICYVKEHDQLEGVLNCSSPNPVDNKTLMNALRKAMHVPIGLPAPKWLLELGARIIKTETELILKSRWVIPERLTEAGFKFEFPNLEEALKNLV